MEGALEAVVNIVTVRVGKPSSTNLDPRAGNDDPICSHEATVHVHEIGDDIDHTVRREHKAPVKRVKGMIDCRGVLDVRKEKLRPQALCQCHDITGVDLKDRDLEAICEASYARAHISRLVHDQQGDSARVTDYTNCLIHLVQVITQSLNIKNNHRTLDRWEFRLDTSADDHVSDRGIKAGFATQQ